MDQTTRALEICSCRTALPSTEEHINVQLDKSCSRSRFGFFQISSVSRSVRNIAELRQSQAEMRGDLKKSSDDSEQQHLPFSPSNFHFGEKQNETGASGSDWCPGFWPGTRVTLPHPLLFSCRSADIKAESLEKPVSHLCVSADSLIHSLHDFLSRALSWACQPPALVSLSSLNPNHFGKLKPVQRHRLKHQQQRHLQCCWLRILTS